MHNRRQPKKSHCASFSRCVNNCLKARARAWPSIYISSEISVPHWHSLPLHRLRHFLRHCPDLLILYALACNINWWFPIAGRRKSWVRYISKIGYYKTRRSGIFCLRHLAVKLFTCWRTRWLLITMIGKIFGLGDKDEIHWMSGFRVFGSESISFFTFTGQRWHRKWKRFDNSIVPK